MADPIRKLLEKQGVRSLIIGAVSSFWTSGVFELFQEFPDLCDSLQREAIFSAARRNALEFFQSLWREKIAPQLGLPANLTIRDFCKAIDALFLRRPIDPEIAYETFVTFLASAVTVRRNRSPVRVAVVNCGYASTPGTQRLLWESETGFQVTFVGFLSVESEHPPEHEFPRGTFPNRYVSPRAVYFRLEGQCTEHAFRRFHRETCRLLRYAFESNALVREFDTRISDYVRNSFRDVLSGQVPTNFREWGDELEIGRLLDAYFSKPTKKDSIDRRLRNALHLVLQSEAQSHTAIGIALSVAAIEALVCSKGSDISNMFAENTAVILEPDPGYRNAAFEFLKALYDARSRVLHGDLLEHEATMRHNARALAAAVLQAVLERRSFQRSAGVESETPDELIKEMRQGKWLPGQLTGVSESPVRTLWGAKYEGPEPDIEDQQPPSE